MNVRQMDVLLAMSVTGAWSDDEIRGSFTPSNLAIGTGLALATVAAVMILLWGAKRKTEYLMALGMATIGILSCVGWIQRLADSLCVDAPLTVKVRGLWYVPFFLGTRDTGLLGLAALFLVANLALIVIVRDRTRLMTRLGVINLALAATVSLAATLAYAAVRLGLAVRM